MFFNGNKKNNKINNYKGEKMKKRTYIMSLVLVEVVLFVVGCAPKALYMQKGKDLDKMIKEKKVTVAVLPTIDWAEDEGFCRGYFLYGCFGALTRARAYSDVGLIVTNELTRALWKKNALKLVKKDTLVEKVKQSNLKPDEIFPKQKYLFCGSYPKPVGGIHKVGKGEPNYEKLYDLGNELGADIIFISRVTRNTQTNYCAQNPIGAKFPWTTIIGVSDYIYKAHIKKYKNIYVAIDIMALDVKNREVIAFGGYNKINQIPSSEKPVAMEQYTKAITFYAPMPAREDLEKEFLANTASAAGTYIANYILQQAGLQLRVAFKFKYEYEDETWKMYPPGTFENNYGLTKSEYYQVLNQ